MTIRVAGANIGEIRFDGPGQIYPRLVGQTNQHPQHVGHFVGEILLLAGLERLVAVLARHDARQLPDLLRKNRHIGQFAEITHAVLLDPRIDALLQFTQLHIRTEKRVLPAGADFRTFPSNRQGRAAPAQENP